MLICTCDGTVTGFGLANPQLFGERDQARQMSWTTSPPTDPRPGTAVVTDKGLSGAQTEEFFASDDLQLTLIRPARKDEEHPRPFPNWLRQRVEAIIWTLKNQLGLERHGGRAPSGAVGTDRPAAARAQRRDLAQLEHRSTRQAILDRLRPLTLPSLTSPETPRFAALPHQRLSRSGHPSLVSQYP